MYKLISLNYNIKIVVFEKYESKSNNEN